MNVEIYINEGRQVIRQLLESTAVRYQSLVPSMLPEKPGIYAILQMETDEVLRAGRTSSLRQRLYRNHLMGNQPKNLPAQLVNGGIIQDLAAAKEWIRGYCAVYYLEQDRITINQNWAEHFMLAVLRPKFSD